MTGHDPCCPLDDLPVPDCTICGAIAAARAEEKHTFAHVWHMNLPLIEKRNYLDGRADEAAGKPIPKWAQ